MSLVPDGSFEYTKVILDPPIAQLVGGCWVSFRNGPAGRWTAYAVNGISDLALVESAICGPNYFAQLPAPDGSNVMYLQTSPLTLNSYTQISQSLTGLSVGNYQLSWFHTVRGSTNHLFRPPNIFQVFACGNEIYSITSAEFPSALGVPVPFQQYTSSIFAINSTTVSDGCIIIFRISQGDTFNRGMLIDNIRIHPIQNNIESTQSAVPSSISTPYNVGAKASPSNDTSGVFIIPYVIFGIGGLVLFMIIIYMVHYKKQVLKQQQEKERHQMNSVKTKQKSKTRVNQSSVSQSSTIKDKTLSRKQEQSITTTTYGKIDGSTTTTSYGNTTIVVNTNQIMAIPAYLKVLPGSYKLERPIARGGFGEIFFISYDPASDLGVSAKGRPLVAKRISSTSTNKSQFMQELSIMNLFNGHPNFVPIYGYDDIQQIIITEFYPVGSLNLWMPKIKSFKIDILINILNGIANAIKEMHERGLVHNDLKTANVLIKISKKGLPSAVLTDFGMANIVDNSVMKVDGFVIANTRGTTINYCAPDRIISQFPLVSPSKAKMADVFSYGMIIYAVLCRKEPWY